MSDLRRADAEGVSAEGAVRGGVAVAAHDQQAREGEALLGADHMHDALTRIVQPEEIDVVFGRIRLEIAHHGGDLRVSDGVVAPTRRHVMIGDAEGQSRLRNIAAAHLHLTEGVKRAFVHIMPVDPQQRGAVLAARDLMRRP